MKIEDILMQTGARGSDEGRRAWSQKKATRKSDGLS
jgi:hypothetical protein